MPHTYAFLWVLLLLRGNDIRFYRGKVRINTHAENCHIRIRKLSSGLLLDSHQIIELINEKLHVFWNDNLLRMNLYIIE